LPPPLGLTVYVPDLALTEVGAVRPDTAPLLADVLTHPSVILGDLDTATAGQVDQPLLDADAFDGCAGHVVHIARIRGWPVLTADPGRLRYADPSVQHQCRL
jgi:hypothetical protein